MARPGFEEKIERLVRLQEMANDIRAIAGRKQKRVWMIV